MRCSPRSWCSFSSVMGASPADPVEKKAAVLSSSEGSSLSNALLSLAKTWIAYNSIDLEPWYESDFSDKIPMKKLKTVSTMLNHHIMLLEQFSPSSIFFDFSPTAVRYI